MVLVLVLVAFLHAFGHVLYEGPGVAFWILVSVRRHGILFPQDNLLVIGVVDDALLEQNAITGNYSEAIHAKLELEGSVALGVQFTNLFCEIVKK